MDGKDTRVSNSAPIIAGFRVQTSAYARAIPRIFGKTRVSANLLWYGDFTAIPHTTTSTQASGGKGGGGSHTSETTTFTYTAAVLMLIGKGVIGGVTKVWRDKEITSPAALGLSLFTGTSAQTAFTHLVTNHPAEALTYRGLAYVASAVLDLGESAQLLNHSFEVEGLLPFSGSIKDANPKDVITAVATEIGIAPARIGALTEVSNYCVANGIFVSPAYTDQRGAAEILAELVRIANAEIVYSEGVIKVIPFSDEAKSGNGATYTPSVSPIFDFNDDDYLADPGEEPLAFEDEDAPDAYNIVKVKFYNRAKDYAEDVAEAQDDDHIALYGRRPMEEPIALYAIVDADIARLVVQNELQKQLYFRRGYRFKLGPGKADLLEPMDVVALTSTKLGITTLPVRIREIEEIRDAKRDGFQFLVRECPPGAGAAVLYPSESGNGYGVDYNADPGDVNTPVILDAPAVATDSGFELWLAVSAPSLDWGGAQVWVATESGGPFKQVGLIHGAARHGVLSAAFALGADPDTVNTCKVDLTTSKGSLLGGTQADADNLNTLAWIEGEFVSFKTATLTAQYKYDLKDYLRRGVFNTAIGAHALNERFVRADQAMFRYAYDPGLIGKTLYIKLPSFNIFGFGQQGLADVSAYTHVIAGPIGAPDAPTGFSVAQVGNVLNFRVDPVPYLKLDRVEIRFADPGEQDWNNGVPVTNILRGNTDSNGSVGPGEWRFMARSFDRAGRPSKTWAVFDLAVNAEGFITILSRDSAPSWTNLQHQNLIDRSEELDNAAWTRTNIKAFGSGSVANATAKPAPDGFATAEYLQADTTNGQHTLSRTALTAASAQTLSAHAAPGEYTKCWLGSGNGSSANRVLFDLAAGTVISQGANVTAAGIGIASSNGYRRLWVAFASVPDAALYFGAVDAANNVSFAGAGTDGLYAWGLQVNNGVVPTAYSKTSTAAVPTHDNFVVSALGALIPDSTQLAGSLADADLWDKYVSHPQTICTYTQPEIDKGIDGTVRVFLDVVSVLGPGVTVGTSDPKRRLDYRLAAGAYDGFEDWAIGVADFRFLKSGLRLDTSVGLAKISEFRTVLDREPFDQAGTYTTSGSGSVAVTFAAPFHIAPDLQVTPQGSGDVSASFTALTSTGFTGHFKSAGAAAAGTANYRAQGV